MAYPAYQTVDNFTMLGFGATIKPNAIIYLRFLKKFAHKEIFILTMNVALELCN